MRTSILSTAVLTGFAILLSGCGGGGGGTSPAPAPLFYVTGASPADGSNDVDTSVHIVLTFSESVDPSTLGPQAIQVGILGEGAVIGLPGLVAGTSGKAVEVAPVSILNPGKPYAILVSGALRSTTGHAIGGTLQFLFRTKSGPGGGVVLPPPEKLLPTLERLKQGRRSHTATLLDDGRVLLCGGYVAGTFVTDKAETFASSGESFTLLASRMRSPRASHAAAKLADGRVLLCGGLYEASSGSLVSTATAEIFDPASGVFTDVAPMSTQRVDHTATLLPTGKVLVTGGSKLVGTAFQDLTSVELFDPATNTWSPAPHDLVHTHAVHSVVDLLDGRFLVVGGSDVDLRPEIYTIATGVFATITPATTDIARFGAAVGRYADGAVTVVGGESQGQVLVFAPTTTSFFNSGSPTSMPRAYATVSPIGPSRMLVVGGFDYTNGNNVEASCDLLVEGGANSSTTYATTVRFPTGMAMHTATVLGDGRILFCGGINATSGQPELDGAYIYTP